MKSGQGTPERRVAYVSRVSYPDPAANALQTLHTSASLAASDWGVELFAHDFPRDREAFLTALGVPASDFVVRSLQVSRWPLILRRSRYLSAAYNSLIAARLAATNWSAGVRSVVFVRSRLEITYWGLMRRRFPWLTGWLLACEIHDLPGLDDESRNTHRTARLLEALYGFDLAVAVNHGLAEDLSTMTQGRVDIKVLPLASGLPRVDSPAVPKLNWDGMRLGYVGTVDEQHGVADLIRALADLPDSWTLTLVGRSPKGYDRQLSQLAAELGVADRLEHLPPVPYAKAPLAVADLDICLAPTGDNVHRQRYVSPLKIFDYMACGKPIVAADSPAHREILRDSETAVLYPQGDPRALAAKLSQLASEPSRLAAIARAAWEEGARHTYTHRATSLRNLFDAAIEAKSREQRG